MEFLLCLCHFSPKLHVLNGIYCDQTGWKNETGTKMEIKNLLLQGESECDSGKESQDEKISLLLVAPSKKERGSKYKPLCGDTPPCEKSKLPIKTITILILCLHVSFIPFPLHWMISYRS